MRTLQSSWWQHLAAELVPADEPPADEDAPPTPLWTPFPDSPQEEAFNSPADLLFYGGAAGGAKTDLLLGLAVMAHRRSIIFRRVFPQLSYIEDRLRAIIGLNGSYNSQRHRWTMPGRSIELGAVQYLKDRTNYQGRPHDLKAFDEVSEFLEGQFRFLIGWLRTEVIGQRCRVVAAGNPPTSAEGEWVMRFWGPWLDDQHPRPALPGELRWFAMLPGENDKWQDVEVENAAPIPHGDQVITPQSRTFIPARVEDNPVYMSTGYKATLQALPEPLRSQLLKGDFAAGREDNPWQVIPTAWVKAAQERWKLNPQAPGPMTTLGVDVARGGKDQTVLAPRHATWFGRLLKYPGKATPDGPAVGALALAALRDCAHLNVDVIGVGASVYDWLVGKRAPVVGVNVSWKSLRHDDRYHTDRTGKLQMRNVRAYGYWLLRDALDPETGSDLALPPDPELLADLVAHRWGITASGIEVESKEGVVARLGRSPDCGEALMLAHLPTVLPAFKAAVSGERTWSKSNTDL